MKLQRQTSLMVAGAILLMALLAAALMLPGCGTQAAKSGGHLTGQFPTVDNLSKKVVRMQSKMVYYADAPWTSQVDLWVDGSTGQYRKEDRKNDALTGVEAFDGRTFRRYATESHSAVSWSKELLATVEPTTLSKTGSTIRDLRASTAALIKPAQKGSAAVEYEGRKATKYHVPANSSDHFDPYTYEEVVDNDTGLPLESTAIGVDGKTVYSTKYDYEVSSPKEGFGLQFPQGYQMDRELENSAEAQRELALSEVAAKAKQPVFALGDQFDGLRISRCNFSAGMVHIRYSDSPNEKKVAPTKYISLTEFIPSKLDPETSKNTDNGDAKVGSLTTKWGTAILYKNRVTTDLMLELTIEGVRVRIMYAPRGTSEYLVKVANSLTKVAG